MVENFGVAAAEFAVVFFNGEIEVKIGNVRIDGTMEYKPFQLLLSQKIGISPNQISIYLVVKRTPLERFPITGKINFGNICLLKEPCCFLVVLKRKTRNRNMMMTRIESGGDFVPENAASYYYDDDVAVGNEKKEIGSLSLNLGGNEVRKKVYCQECENEKKEKENGGEGTSSFHACVNDLIVTRFKSRFGPIGPVTKS